MIAASGRLTKTTYSHAKFARNLAYVDAAVYKHKWALGELVLWDHRTTMRRRDAFDPRRPA